MEKRVQKAYIILLALVIFVPAAVYGVTRTLPLESALTTFNSYMDLKLLGSSSSADVLVGKDGWLFYTGGQDNDEDQLADYLGTNLYTEEELSQIAANMTAMRDEIEASGARFIMVINPNKMNVYSDRMPSRFGEKAADNRLSQVIGYLNENTDLTVISTLEAMEGYRAAHPDTDICFKYDTHWNDIGAYVATCEVNRALGLEARDIDTLTLSENPSPPDYDLARLLHLTNTLTDDKVPVVNGYTDFYVETTADEEGRNISSHNYGVTGEAGKLLMIGDSYGAFMERYLSCNFHDTRFIHYRLFDRKVLEEERPDVVIFETVERYMKLLFTYSADGYQGDPE